VNKLTLQERIDLPDVPAVEGGPPVLECGFCNCHFDMREAYIPRFDVLECPRCHAVHLREGQHWVLDRDGVRPFDTKYYRHRRPPWEASRDD